MRKTLFAGLTQLDPGESLASDGYSFQSRNPDIIDHFLQVGAVTHRHDAHAALGDPTDPPTVVGATTGGQIPAGRDIYVAYSLLDADGGETITSDVEIYTTADAIGAPTDAPDATMDYTAGGLLIGSYYYAITLGDNQGGETPMGSYALVNRESGHASGQASLTGMGDIAQTESAEVWFLYRASNGGQFYFLASGASGTNNFVDDGVGYCLDCTRTPPRSDSTRRTNKITVTVPSGGIMAQASAFRLYVSQDGTFHSPCLKDTYPAASAGTALEFLDLTVESGSPPTTSTTVGGASQIDPDTDLLDFPWKRPVSGSGALPPAPEDLTEIRMDSTTGHIWRYFADDWHDLDDDRHRENHTFALGGDVRVASGAQDYIPPFFAGVQPGWTLKLVKLVHKILQGSATIEIQREGAMIASAAVTTAKASVQLPIPVGVNDEDEIALVVTQASGGTKHLTASLHFEVAR